MTRIARVTTRGTAVAAALLVLAAGRARADEAATGIALYREGKYAEAESHLRQAEGVEAQGYLAASLARQKKHAEAEALSRAILKDTPTQEMAVAALGEALVGQKKYDAAVTDMSAAIKAKADLAYAWYWRGQAYYNKKQPDRMISDFETFLKLAPKAPEAATVQQLLAGLRG